MLAACGPRQSPEHEAAVTPTAIATTPTPDAGSELFRDVSATSNIDVRNLCGGPDKEYILEVNGAGACWLDYDGDGALDVYVVNGSTLERLRGGEPGEPNRLFRGDGTGRFTEVEAAAGADDRSWGFGCSVADFDNDGWSDLIVTNYGPNVLYRNVEGRGFVDWTVEAGLSGDRWSTGAVFSDLDRDGHLDLFIANYLWFDIADPPVDGKVVDGVALSCKWAGEPVMCGPTGLIPEGDRLYRGLGDGRFEDVTEAAGITAAQAGYGFAAVPLDYDNDGSTDIYVANDSVPNHLWHNLGGFRFEDVALATGSAVGEDGKPQASMGLDAQDYDGDGWVDLVFTNFARESNALLRNLGQRGLFFDAAFVAGLGASTIRYLGWGVEFHDLDNDADLDLFIVNGHVYPGAGAEGDGGWRQRNQIFLHDDGRFTDVTARAGAAMQVRRVGRGAAFADFDVDGAVDVLLTNLDEPPTLLRNVGPAGHWLEIELIGTRSNRDGHGARVRAHLADGRVLHREAHGGSSYLSGTSKRIHFGLGDAQVIPELRVVWPSGVETTLRDVAVDRLLTIREGGEDPLSEEGAR